MDWFRFYVDSLDKPKIQLLPDRLFKVWVNLLCLARIFGGKLPPLSVLAFRLRVDEDAAQGYLVELAARRLLDKSGDEYTPHDWQDHQYDSDSSTERVRRFRNRNPKKINVLDQETDTKRSSNVTGNGFCSVSVSSPASEILKPEKKTLYSKYEELLSAWQEPSPSGKVFGCADVDLGSQVWISAVDAGQITDANISEVFAGLQRWKNSVQWDKGMVHSVPTWLGYKKNGLPAAPRWNDKPEQIQESEY